MNIAKITALAGIAAASIAAQAVTHVDVMVAFDTKAVAAVEADGTTLQAFAEAQVAKSNEVLTNSGLSGDFDFRLVGTHEWAFTHGDTDTMYDTLMMTTNETAAAAMHAARENVGADVVVVVISPSATGRQKGLSYLMQPYMNGERQYGLDFEHADEYLVWFSDMAYAVVDYTSCKESYTFVHEVGHVMGAGHAEQITEDPGPALYPYSTGWMAQGIDGNYYSTVMGYNRATGDSETPYTVLPYFSSPNLVNPETLIDSLGDADHDNVRTLRNTCGPVSNFRAAKVADGGDTPSDGGGDTPSAGDGGNSGGSSGSGTAVVVRPSGLFTEKKTTIGAAILDNGEVVGSAQFVVTATRNGVSKATCTVIGLDGKKKKTKSVKSSVYADAAGTAFVDLDGVAVKGFDGTLSATLGSDGSLTGGTLGSLALVPADLGVSEGSASFWIDETIPSLMGETVVSSVDADGAVYSTVPYATSPEAVTFGAKWTVAKASKIKLKRDRATGQSNLILSGTENLSGLKLNYQAKTGTFKGSFTVYTINAAGKLKKNKFNVTGVVVNGEGVGIGLCKKAGYTVPVYVGAAPVCGDCTFSE